MKRPRDSGGPSRRERAESRVRERALAAFDTSELVSLGVVVRAHGLRGEVRIKPWNDESRLLAELDRVALMRQGAAARVVAFEARHVTDGWLAVIEGVTERDGAEAMRGVEVGVPREALPAIDDDEVYLVDLIGLEVWDGDRKVGVVDGFFEYPSVNCLQVTGDDGVRELPMLDAFVTRVDKAGSRIEATRTDELPVEAKRPGKDR